MNYFPMFMDIRGREVLICGGGMHALEKVERLTPFGADILVISRRISPEMECAEGIRIERRSFSEKDLDSFPVFVIAAENRKENERISNICRTRHIPVNAVDMQDICDFIFPALITSGQMCVGISTGGVSPAVSVELKRRIEECIPDDVDDILLWMNGMREEVRRRIPDKEKQRKVLRQMAKRALEEGRRLTWEELEK